MTEDIEDPNNRLVSWNFAVVDEFKSKSIDEIKSILQQTNNGFSVLAMCVQGDFNISSLIRSANGFNCQSFYYFGRKKWDRRGSIGQHNYMDLQYLPTWGDVVALKSQYHFVGFENVGHTTRLDQYDWQMQDGKKPLIILGEEGNGLGQNILDLCDDLVEIPMFGSVRSFNLASAGSIAMYDFVAKKLSSIGR